MDTTQLHAPSLKPSRPFFSSGPCVKRPGWDIVNLAAAFLSRSHRAKVGKEKLALVIDETHALLELPDDYRVAIVPASDTGAFEMAMWSLLGARGVDVLSWESFGAGWVRDIVKELKLVDVRVHDADYGLLPDLSKIDFNRDVVFAWNGTTSGVRVPNGDWIDADRAGLTLVDATSAVFAQEIEWAKVDVATFSWQKVLGGEAAHGMLVLSPRAVERLTSYTPPWPMPKLFRLTKGGKLVEGIFRGETINTPSMLCVEDCLDALSWVRSIGGLTGTIARCDANATVLHDWVARTAWVSNLAVASDTWSNTSVCLKLSDEVTQSLSGGVSQKLAKGICALLDENGVAHDIGSYRDAPSGFRIWTGATVDREDLITLTEWLDWAYEKARASI